MPEITDPPGAVRCTGSVRSFSSDKYIPSSNDFFPPYQKHQSATEPQKRTTSSTTTTTQHKPSHRTTRFTYLWLSRERCRRDINSMSQLCVSLDMKYPRVIRGANRLVSALPDPARGFVNYSSLSHLSLAKTDLVRRPDIPKTTVSGVVCVRTPCQSEHTQTYTRTHGPPPVHGAKQPTKSFYVARRHMAFPVSLCSNTPSQPSEISLPPQVIWKRWKQWMMKRRMN